MTEIHDYLRLLWARVGIPHCPECGREIRKQSVDEIVDAVCQSPEGTRMQVLSPLVRGRKGEHRDLLSGARKSGYVRVRIDGTMYDLEDTPELDKKKKHTIEIVVDRLIRREGREFRQRLAEDVETAATKGAGLVIIDRFDLGETLYSMNYACPDCPDERMSLREGALNAMGFNTGEDNGIASQYFQAMGRKYGFTMDTPVERIPPDGMQAILYGTGNEKIRISYEGVRGMSEYETPFEGVIPTLERRYRETTSEAMKQAYEEYMAEETCP